MMPIALLLQDVGRALHKGGVALNPWVRLVELQETLIGRARGAFLVRWFGERLPMQGTSLKVHLANLADLRRHHMEVQRQVRQDPSGMNLIEPLAGAGGGLFGTALGLMLNPVSAISILVVAGLHIEGLGRKLAQAALGVGRGLLYALGAPFLAPFGIAGGVQRGGPGQREEDEVRGIPGPTGLRLVQDAYDLSGAATGMLDQLRIFLDQLAGPVSAVRNPLVRRTLEILGRVAGLFGQVIGAFAVLVDRLTPMILPLVDQVIALRDLVSAVAAMLSFLVEDLIGHFERLPGRIQVFRGVLTLPVEFLGIVLRETGVVLGWAAGRFTSIVRTGIEQVRGLVTQMLLWGRGYIESHPVLQATAEMRRRLGAIRAGFGAFAAAYAAAPSGFFGRAAGAAGRAMLRAGMGAYHAYRRVFPSTSPPAPSWGGLPSTASVLAYAGPPPLVPLEDLGRLPEVAASRYPVTDPRLWEMAGLISPETLERSLREGFSPALPGAVAELPSIFAGEWGRLAQQQGGSPAATLQRMRRDEAVYRDLLTAVIGRVLPPAARGYMGQLYDLFDTIDERVYGVPRRPRHGQQQERTFPVLELQGDRLRPVVHRLVFRVPEGTDEAQVQAFKDQLLPLLRERTYEVSPAERQRGRAGRAPS